ncbi:MULTISPECIES: hypothetical protein [unclassified Nocardioides]|uniref:hypothetical protein n=1 Tax=unclassified Nocardioides TaxID=2615069 RepID=UPI003014954E
MRRTVCLLVLLATLLTAAPAGAAPPIEDYAPYQPQTRCAPKPKPGTVVLGRWLVRRYGGAYGGVSRACAKGSTSEHAEGRAFDWTLDVRRGRDRRAARRMMRDLFATDRAGNPDARARRMGVMYVIWDDRIYSAWNGFAPERYLSSSCRTVRRCSTTLRHRDHVHLSLTRAAARGRTSWFEGRLD